MSHVAAKFTVLALQRVIVFLFQCSLLLLVHESVCIEIVNLGCTGTFHRFTGKGITFRGILAGIALCAGKFVQTVVGLRSHNVVLYFHNLTLCGTHQSGGVVTVAEFLALLTGLTLYPILTYKALGIHGNQCGETVATVDVQALGHWTKAVSGIYVSTVFHVVLHAPVQVVLVVIVRVFPVKVPEPLQTVDVSTLSTDNLAEHTILSHRQSVQLVLVVAAVLQDEAMQTSLLGQVYQAPALFQIHGTGYLYGGVLAILHSELCHGIVVVPVCSNVHQVYVVALA